MLQAHRLKGIEAQRLKALYRATGIKYRYSVISDYSNHHREFFPGTTDLEPFPTVERRMQLFREKALGLALEAIEDCISPIPGFRLDSITHLITVSCTGLYAPGLDIELVEQLGLSSSVERTAVNYMGCYAAINAIRLADSICRARSNAVVLILCLELCSIHFQKEFNQDNLLANALFSDGAAAVIQSGVAGRQLKLQPEKFYCNIFRDGKNEMAWSIGNFGFVMRLSAYVPGVIKSGIRQSVSQLLDHCQMELGDIDFFAIHPGGKLILEVIENELEIERARNEFGFEILRNYGNMSSVSVLFVLKKIVEKFQYGLKDHGNILAMAFGPGLTLESMVLSVSRSRVSDHEE